MSTVAKTAPKPVLSVLEHEFLQKVAAQTLPASIPEMNAGAAPRWNLDAADALLQLGLIGEPGWDSVHDAPRYAATEAGRVALSMPPKPLPAPQVDRFGYARPARRGAY